MKKTFLKINFYFSKITDETVYWTDLETAEINRASLWDGTNHETLVFQDVDTPDGMAVDVNGRNLFWTDTDTKRIEMIRLDGTYRRIIISHDLDAPRDISLDTMNGWIYWSDWGTNPRIGKIRKLALKKIGPVYLKLGIVL